MFFLSYDSNVLLSLIGLILFIKYINGVSNNATIILMTKVEMKTWNNALVSIVPANAIVTKMAVSIN